MKHEKVLSQQKSTEVGKSQQKSAEVGILERQQE
jgi:hypothetical protein